MIATTAQDECGGRDVEIIRWSWGQMEEKL